MSCAIATAALSSVCAMLPDLGEPPEVPVMPHWGIRQAVVDYRRDKTVWSQRSDFFGWHAIGALGDTRRYQFERNVLRSRKTIYLYAAQGDVGVMVMPTEKAIAVRWEFD
jgi:hypothetical protein